MQKATIILLTFALAATASARSQRSDHPWFRQLKGWRKLLGLIALVTALIIVLNPEFLALDLLGDSAFFDMLALALSVQMLVSVQGVWHHLSGDFVRTMRWIGLPSPGFRYLMVVPAAYITTAISAPQKLAHRLSS